MPPRPPRGSGPRGGGPPRGAPPPRGGRGRGVPPPTINIASHIQTIGVRKPGFGREGRELSVWTNHFQTTVPTHNIYHYDVVIGPAEKNLPARLNFEIIEALQRSNPIFNPRAVYDGRKNLFSSHPLEFTPNDRQQEFDVYLSAPGTGSQPGPKPYKVRLTQVAKINPEVLSGFLVGNQSHDNTVLTAITALNVVVRMEPSLKYPFNVRSFFTNTETKDIGNGMVLWRGYFQSVRPGISRLLINIDISTGVMYKDGPLIQVALAFLGKDDPRALSIRGGLIERERHKLARFLSGIRVTTTMGAKAGATRANPRVIKKLSSQGAADLRFALKEGGFQTVAEYFARTYTSPLRYPDVLCVEVGSGAMLPMEVCVVPAGQIMRKQVPPEKTKDVLEFATQKPQDRLQSIINGHKVLKYGQSEYTKSFGLRVDVDPVQIAARILTPPKLIYGQGGRQTEVDPRNGEWNMVDKKLFRPAEIRRWLIIIYERQQRFQQGAAQSMIAGLRQACSDLGIKGFESEPEVYWENAQSDIIPRLKQRGLDMKSQKGGPPDIYILVLPEGAADLYQQIKHFSDCLIGVPTQCLKALKCFRAKPQYYANVCLKINVKLGGVNTVPDARSVPFLSDRNNPTMVVGADVIHPAPGVDEKPSFTSMVANIDPMYARYVAISKVQRSRQEIIDDTESMMTHLLNMHTSYKRESRIEPALCAPKRVLFFRDGVSEGQFKQVIDEEIPKIKAAFKGLGVQPKLTVVVVGKRHHVRFFPQKPNEGDRSGNCYAGLVVDREVTSPAEFDFYLQSHAGLLGTSRPAHYNVLYDENNLTPDTLQQISFALCHVYARSTRSVSIPAPVYYADIVCARAKNHFDPSSVGDLSDDPSTPLDSEKKGATKTLSYYQNAFKPLAGSAQRRMYFS